MMKLLPKNFIIPYALDGKIEIWDFSFNFGEWLVASRGDLLIEENEELFNYFNENVLEEMELLPDYTLDINRELFTRFLNEAKAFVN